MEITGPFLDEAKKQFGRPACWYLRYSAPKRNADGTLVLAENGRPVIQRYRPFYETKVEALADIPWIRGQYDVAGSGQFIFNRRAADDYESALKIAGGVAVLELAKFWRHHHPEKPKRRLRELMEAFLADVKLRHGDGAHYRDLKSRGRASIARRGQTMRNHKTAVDMAVHKAAQTCSSLHGRRITPHVWRHSTAMYLIHPELPNIIQPRIGGPESSARTTPCSAVGAGLIAGSMCLIRLTSDEQFSHRREPQAPRTILARLRHRRVNSHDKRLPHPHRIGADKPYLRCAPTWNASTGRPDLDPHQPNCPPVALQMIGGCGSALRVSRSSSMACIGQSAGPSDIPKSPGRP